MSIFASSSRSARVLLRNVHPSSSGSFSKVIIPRTYATFTEIPRPPPPTKQPEPVTFSAPSRPRQYYARPQIKRDLPPVQRKWPVLLALCVAGVSIWAAFFAYATNQEKLTSSVVKQIISELRECPELVEALGEGIRFEPAWWLNGDPWITGSNQLLAGNVDLSFRVKGNKGAGRLYFTSIRKAKGDPFTILRFKVIADNGKVINVPLSTLS